MPPEIEVHFSNVAITVSAPTAVEAYNRLCTGLEGLGFAYTTDTFSTSVDTEEDDEERDTSELWPE